MSAIRSKTSRLLVFLPLLLLVGACTSEDIVFNYPEEELDFKLRNLRTPSVFIDSVTDMRPTEQRQGQGHFWSIQFPKDSSWDRPVSEIYAEALAQDVEQTNLMQLVPLRGQADLVMSADILSLGCRFDRGFGTLLLPAAIGAGLGMALGDDGSDRTKLAIGLGIVAILAIPMPSKDVAEVEVRLTLKDRDGDILWQKSCLGEVEERVFATATARQDQDYVNDHLTKAVKRANACLLGQMRQYLIEVGQPE